MAIPYALQSQLKSFTLPVAPNLSMRIIDATKNPNLNVRQLVAIMSVDAGLCERILKLANSSLYHARAKCENLGQALQVLGLNLTLTAGLSYTLVESVQNAGVCGLDCSRLWRRSMLSGIAARTLAELLNPGYRDDLFMAALLQDVGILALIQINCKVYLACKEMPANHRHLIDQELAHFKVDHAEVGAHILTRWKMPDVVIDAVAKSHATTRKEARGALPLFNEMLALSGPLADLFLMPSSPAGCDEVANLAQNLLGLSSAQMLRVLTRVGEVLRNEDDLFKMDMGDNPDALLDGTLELLALRVEAELAANCPE